MRKARRGLVSARKAASWRRRDRGGAALAKAERVEEASRGSGCNESSATGNVVEGVFNLPLLLGLICESGAACSVPETKGNA